MNTPLALFLAAFLLAPGAAMADGKRKHAHEFKETFWDGACKVERKLDKKGRYKEERKCKGGHAPAVVLVPQPVYVPAPVVVVEQPGVVIHGTVRVR